MTRETTTTTILIRDIELAVFVSQNEIFFFCCFVRVYGFVVENATTTQKMARIKTKKANVIV